MFGLGMPELLIILVIVIIIFRKVAFRGIEGDTLLFTADTTMQVAWGAVERLDILTGHGTNVWLGAGLGFLGGATVGLLIAAAAPQGEDREEVILYPAAGALLGTLLGTFVGLEGRTDPVGVGAARRRARGSRPRGRARRHHSETRVLTSTDVTPGGHELSGETSGSAMTLTDEYANAMTLSKWP